MSGPMYFASEPERFFAALRMTQGVVIMKPTGCHPERSEGSLRE